MKNSEIRELTTEDLKERILAEKANLTKMTMNHVVSPLEIRCKFGPSGEISQEC